MIRRLMVLVLMICAACSSPLHETAEPAQPAETQVATEQPAATPAPSLAPSPAPVEEPPAAPAETPAKPVAAVPAPVERPKPQRVLVTPDPVKAVFAEEDQRVEREQLVVRLAAERDAAAAVVARREKDLLAFKNPFLPRPQLTPDEAAEIKGMGGAARAQWAEQRVLDAKAELAAAQKAYDDATATR